MSHQAQINKLYQEKNKIQRQIDKLEAVEQIENHKKVLTSDVYVNLKAEAEALLKESKTFFKNEEFVINLPIRFNVKNLMKFRSVNHLFFDEYDDNIFDLRIDAKLDGTPAALNLTRLQHQLLQNGLFDVIDSACEDIIKILPKHLLQQIEDYKKRLLDFQKKVKALENKHQIEIKFYR